MININKSFLAKPTIWIVFIFYIIILFKLIFKKYYPFTVLMDNLKQFNKDQIISNMQFSNLTPFKTIHHYIFVYDVTNHIIIENIVGNVVAFIPIGFLLPILNRKLNKFGQIFLISFVVSLFFEITQFVFSIGSFDVDDLILNTTGGIIGLLCLKIATIFHRKGYS